MNSNQFDLLRFMRDCDSHKQKNLHEEEKPPL